MKRIRLILIPLFAALTILLTATIANAETILRQTQTTTTSTVLTWNGLFKDSKTSKVLSYKVVWGPSRSNMPYTSPVLSAQTTKFQINGLAPNSNYYAELQCTIEETTPAGGSNVIDLTTPQQTTTPTTTPQQTTTKQTVSKKGLTIYTVPGKVTKFPGYDYLYSQTGFEIYWKKPEGTNKNYYEYEFYNLNGKRLMSGQSNNRSLYFTSFKYNQQVLKFRVRALHRNDSTGEVLAGEWSKKKTLIPQPILKIDSTKYSINEDGKLKIAWNRVKGATKYIIYASKKPIGEYRRIGSIKQGKKRKIAIKLKKNFSNNTIYYIKVLTYVKGVGKGVRLHFLPIWRYSY